MRLIPLCPVLASLCFCAGLQAEEDGSSWLSRLTIGIAPGTDTLEFDGSSSSVPDDASISVEGIILYKSVSSTGLGWCAGGGLVWRSHSAEEDGFSLDYDAYGVRLTGGVVYDMIGGFSFEGRPYVDYGLGDFSWSDNDTYGSFSDTSASNYLAYGLVAGAYYSFGTFQLGAEIGYQGFSGEADIDGGSTLTAEGTGVTYGISFAWGF